MRLRRINRPKAAIITAKQRLLIMVEKREAVKRECTDKNSEEPLFYPKVLQGDRQRRWQQPTRRTKAGCSIKGLRKGPLVFSAYCP